MCVDVNKIFLFILGLEGKGKDEASGLNDSISNGVDGFKEVMHILSKR